MAELTPADAFKKEGNAHFAKADYLKAAAAYTKAIKAAPTNHVLYSNRAQVHVFPHCARTYAGVAACMRLLAAPGPLPNAPRSRCGPWRRRPCRHPATATHGPRFADRPSSS